MDRVEKAKQNFKNGYNCAQSVVAAFSDAIDMSEEDVLRITEGFGGGMGRMRLTCGAVSGMTALAGIKLSGAKAGDLETRTKIYETVQKMAHEFEEKNGSIVCAELLGLDKKVKEGVRPSDRTAEYYKKRPCVDCVGDCAEIAQKYLFNN